MTMQHLIELRDVYKISQMGDPAVHALDDLFATLAKNCAKSGIIETEEPPELLSHIATDLIIHELYVWCSQNGNFCLRERARQYAEVAYHVKPQYRMSPEQRAAL